MKDQYEVEVKSLLGAKENADQLRKKLSEIDPGVKLIGKGKQLNHYFLAPTDATQFDLLKKVLMPLLPEDTHASLTRIAEHGTKVSVRTRETDTKTLFIIKASVSDDTSSNGVARIEFEAPVKMSLGELDNVLVEKVGLKYQAKWSREREEYEAAGLHICLDKNAGYGYLAEFEKVVGSEAEVAAARAEIDKVMQSVGVVELDQARLERMFAHYNAHWPEYYGTDNIFTIE
jgi:adenylate cyclase class IV